MRSSTHRHALKGGGSSRNRIMQAAYHYCLSRRKPHIRVISRQVFALFEAQTVYLISCIEDSINKDRVDIEVRFHLIIRKTVLLFLHFCRIIEAVVRLQLKVSTLCFTCIFFDSISFCNSFWLIFFDKLVKESIRIVRYSWPLH